MTRRPWFRPMPFARQSPLRRPRARKPRLVIDTLEDRTVPAGGEWLAVIGGMAPGHDLEEQTEFGQHLLEASGVSDQDVRVHEAVDLSGTFILQTSSAVTEDELEEELHNVPGFITVQEFEDGDPDQADGGEEGEEGERPGSDLIDFEAIEETYGPFDYNAFLSAEKNGQFPPQGGPVDPGPADVQTNNDTGNAGTGNFTQSETSVLAFGNTVLVAFNDSGSNAGGSNKFTGYSRSTDGGNTFVDGGTLPTNPAGDAGDPVLARDEVSGRIYFATLGFSDGNVINVFRSDDGGATWQAPVNATPGGSSEDKEWLAVDNFAGPGQGNVYMVARNFGSGNGIFFTRSTNGGTTWGPAGGTAIALAGATQGAFVTVTPDHAVEVFWFNGANIQMRKSTDQGLTFGPPVTVATFITPGGTNGDLGLTGIRQGVGTASGFRSSRFPHAAVNPANGNIYVTYGDKGAGTDKADIYLVQSTDGGATWGAPLKVNDDVTTTDQWQPTIAVTPGGDKLGVFYYSRQEDPLGNNLFKYYGRVASISGSTLNFAPSFAVSSTPSLPEFGRDNVVNSVYMGDYNTAYATAGAFHVVWSDNRLDLPLGAPRKNPDVFYQKVALGLAVTTTTPAVGSIVSSIPVDYVVNFTDPIQAGTVDASDFTVDGVPADSVVVNTSTQVTFHFNSPPFSAQGQHAMAMAAGAILRDPDGSPLAAFSGTFRYDAVLLQVVSTVPPVGGTFTLPGPFTYDVNFNEAVDPSSVQTGDLVVGGIGGAFVSGVTVLPGNTTARFTISGLTTTEGTLTASIAAGQIADAFGNPGAAFSASYQVDIGTVPYPTPLAAKNPAGSLVYDPSISGVINFAGDVDSFTLNVDPGQTITVLVSPTAAGLQPSFQLRNPSNALIGTATAAAGQKALLQTVPAPAGGTYTVSVTGAGGSTGGYTVQVVLNAALEIEGNLAGNNNTVGTAQNINGSVIGLQTSLAQAARGAALGVTDSTAGYSATPVPFEFTEISATGTHVLANADDSTTTISIPFGFNFYGTTSTSVGFSSNGLITFGGTDGGFTNADLTTSPTLAAIAPFWDDLFTGPNGVVWQVVGSPGSRQLVIEWDNARFFSGGTNTLKFEAVLSEGSNNIQFNYLNLSNGGSGSEGTSATVGVKGAGTQGPNRLLLAFNNGPNAFVGSGKSTLLSVAPPSPDYYSFTLGAGETATVAATAQGAGNLALELRDAADTTLATGVGGSTNLGKVISNFTGAPGTYFVRVGGDGNVPYNLVVTRNTAFDTEGNDSAAAAQAIGPSRGALGAIAASGVYEATAVPFTFEDISSSGTVITGLDGQDDAGVSIPIGFTFPLYGVNNTSVSVTSNGLLTFGGTDSSFTNANLTTSPTLAAIAPFWDDLHTAGGQPTSHVYSRVSGSGADQHLTVQWNQIRFFSGGTTGDTLTFEAQLYADGRIQFNYPDLVSGTAAGNNGASATVGIKAAGTQGPNRLLLAFNNGPNTFVGTGKSTLISQPPGDDWYAVTLAPGQTQLQLETSTPADGPGEFVNVLNPHIELYDGTGTTLIATGSALADGRNESILMGGLTPGATYKVRVAAEGSTTGTYFLGTTRQATPTPTALVDNRSWGFRAVGSGWDLVPAGYAGDSRSHAAGTGSNYAEWTYGQNFTAGTAYQFYATWVPNVANATNAAYQLFDGATPLGTVTVNQQLSPNSVLYNGTAWQLLYNYTPATTGFHTIRIRLTDNANGRVSADAVFDPPLVGIGGLSAPPVPGATLGSQDHRPPVQAGGKGNAAQRRLVGRRVLGSGTALPPAAGAGAVAGADHLATGLFPGKLPVSPKKK